MATITGTALDDRLVGVAGQPDALYGLAGNDTLTGEVPLAAPPIVRVSTGAGGVQAMGASADPVLGTDGRYVLFQSYAANLVAGDTNGLADIFLKDTLTGSITRVNTSGFGAQATGTSFSPAASAGGRYVAFDSFAANLVAGDTNRLRDVFLKDTLTGAITRVDTTAAGAEATGGGSFAPRVSADGRYVVFASDATNLVPGDSNGARDIFRKDLATGAISRVNTGAAGTQASGGISIGPAASADGRYVAFASDATDLVPGDSNGVRDVFRKDTLTGAILRVSTDAAGAQATGGASTGAAISADGRYVAFQSAAGNLVAGDSNGVADIFVKDTLTGAMARVSTNAAGLEATGASSAAAISADGRYVVFLSEAADLVAGDSNRLADVFVKDTWTGAIARVNTDAAGAQTWGALGSPVISADGRYVAFAGNARTLVGGDTNWTTDVFRVLNPLREDDVLRGGPGNDTYVIAMPNDRVIEAPNESTDTVYASLGYALPDHVENLVLTGTGAIRGTGNALDNILRGNGAVNTLIGGAGNDTLTGGGPLVVPIARVSTGANGAQATGTFGFSNPAICADGRHVVFESSAVMLPGDTQATGGLLLKDTLTGALTRVTATTGGADGSDPALSADGRNVVFTSWTANLVAGDTNQGPDIFRKDILTGAITRVSTSALGAQALGGASSAPSVSADGRYVAFASEAYNLVAGDANGVSDIFLKDTLTGAITRASTGTGGTQATGGGSFAPNLSADGRYVVFESYARDLVANDTNGQTDVFLKDMATGATLRVNTSATGAEALGGMSGAAAVSTGGRYVTFESSAGNLVAGDTNRTTDVFLKDTVTGAITRVSTSATGAEATGASAGPALSADGRYVAFVSAAANLVAGDTNGVADVFVKDTRTGAIARLSTDAGGAQATAGSLGAAISGDGCYVTFASTASNLVAGDTNGMTDVFRVLNPLLDGDLLQGGPGDDTYLVAVPKDRVIEAANEGIDTVRSPVGYTLSADVENLVLTGDGAVRGTGNALANHLTGNVASNLLNGGAGADTMVGGGGGDTYVVDDAGDVVTELPGGGADTVLSSVTLALPNEVENLKLTGLTGTEAINGSGNGLNNLIIGNAGNNVLNGGAGVDTVSYAYAAAGVTVRIDLAPVVNATGGAGTDRLINFENIIGSAYNDTLTGSAGNNVIEGGAGNDVLDGGAGSDTASYATAGAAVTVNLGFATPQNTGGAGMDTLRNFEYLIGSRFNDTLTGDAGNNVLKGGAGADRLTGGAGMDSFVFNSKLGADIITDFVSGTDKLCLSQAGLRVGDGDTLVENAVAVEGPGGFAANAELVIVTRNIADFIGPAVAAAVIGSASTAYAAGATSLFAVRNGTETAIYLFTSAGADALVSATELTLLGMASGTTATGPADYLFVA